MLGIRRGLVLLEGLAVYHLSLLRLVSSTGARPTVAILCHFKRLSLTPRLASNPDDQQNASMYVKMLNMTTKQQKPSVSLNFVK